MDCEFCNVECIKQQYKYVTRYTCNDCLVIFIYKHTDLGQILEKTEFSFECGTKTIVVFHTIKKTVFYIQKDNLITDQYFINKILHITPQNKHIKYKYLSIS